MRRIKWRGRFVALLAISVPMLGLGVSPALADPTTGPFEEGPVQKIELGTDLEEKLSRTRENLANAIELEAEIQGEVKVAAEEPADDASTPVEIAGEDFDLNIKTLVLGYPR